MRLARLPSLRIASRSNCTGPGLFLTESKLTMHPEYEFILQALGNAISHSGNKRVVVHDSLDWPHLFFTAARHGVLPLLYCGIKGSKCELPEKAFAQLRAMFYHNVGKALAMVREMLAILEMLEKHAIPVVPFKGAALASQLHGDIAFRQCGDLDFLVQRRDVLKAKKLLISRSYRPQFDLDESIQHALLRSECEVMFSSANGKTFVDLHWAIAPSYSVRIDMKHIWERMQQARLEEKKIRALSPEDRAWLLCIHASKHCWQRLVWISDIACLLAAEQTDWGAVWRRARRTGTSKMVKVSIFLARDLLALDLPKQFSSRRDNETRALCQLVCKHVFGREQDWNSAFFQLRLKERGQDKFRYFACSLIGLNQADYSLVDIPPCLFPLYYLVRILRLLWKYGKRIIHRIFLRGNPRL